MMNRIYLLLLTTLLFVSCKDKPTYVQMETTAGTMIFKLYDETPLHKDNFVNLVEDGFYDSLLFHRVIDEFMIQGGDPNSRNAKERTLLGTGTLDYEIPAEFNDSLFHKKGVLAAARGDHPEKASSPNQFYIVDGKTWTDRELEGFEKRASGEDDRNLKFSPIQVETYKTIGGSPFLDQNYTVFGELIVGIDVVDSISDAKVDRNNRPVENIMIIKAEVIRYKEK